MFVFLVFLFFAFIFTRTVVSGVYFLFKIQLHWFTVVFNELLFYILELNVFHCIKIRTFFNHLTLAFVFLLIFYFSYILYSYKNSFFCVDFYCKIYFELQRIHNFINLLKKIIFILRFPLNISSILR